MIMDLKILYNIFEIFIHILKAWQVPVSEGILVQLPAVFQT